MLTGYRLYLFAALLVISSVGVTLGVTEYYQLNNHAVVEMVADIDGPQNAPVGEMVEYKVNVKGLPWFTKDPLWQWTITDSISPKVHFRTSWDKTTIWFAASRRAKYYDVVVAGTAQRDLWLIKYEIPLGVFVKRVPVGDNPEPGPHPRPHDIPEGKFDIAVVSYENFPAQQAKLASRLKGNYEKVAKSIDDGDLTKVEDVFARIKENNHDVLARENVDNEAISSWNNALKGKIKKLYDDHKLVQLNDYSDLFKEIAIGLSYVK